MSDCIFCKIINKEIPSEIVFENEVAIAFKDINPKARVHVLVVPKKHIASVNVIAEADIELVGKLIYQAKLLASELDIAGSGYKLIFNCGQDGGQAVSHLHLHLLGGEPLAGIV